MKNLSGKGTKGGNQITLLHKKDTVAGEWQKHVFIQHLHSPFGMQLIGESLYVANADAIVEVRYHSGDTQITKPGIEFGTFRGP